MVECCDCRLPFCRLYMAMSVHDYITFFHEHVTHRVNAVCSKW